MKDLREPVRLRVQHPRLSRALDRARRDGPSQSAIEAMVARVEHPMIAKDPSQAAATSDELAGAAKLSRVGGLNWMATKWLALVCAATAALALVLTVRLPKESSAEPQIPSRAVAAAPVREADHAAPIEAPGDSVASRPHAVPAAQELETPTLEVKPKSVLPKGGSLVRPASRSHAPTHAERVTERSGVARTTGAEANVAGVDPGDLGDDAARPGQAARRDQPARPPAAAETELSILAEAQRALRRHDGQRALELTTRHRREFGSGAFSEEREKIAIEALHSLGSYAALRERIRAFHRAFPHSVYAAHIRELAAHAESGAPPDGAD